MKRCTICMWAAVCFGCFPLFASAEGEAEKPIRVEINMQDAGRHLVHVREVLPVHAGENAFEYPQWIQGEHAPTGPIDAVTGIFFHASGGKALVWRRDLTDMYQFHVQVPADVREVELRFDFLAVPGMFDRDNAMAYRGVTGHLAMLEMSNYVMYPAGRAVREIPAALTLHMPAGWSYGTALEPEGDAAAGADPVFKAVSVEQLVDSPIVIGEHCRKYPLAPEVTPKHTLDVCADTEAELVLQPALLEAMANTVRQAGRLFGAYHYAHYDFVLTVSKRIQGDSEEHHQSADYRVNSLDFANDETRTTLADLLPHEYIHSWCGKYRRPVGIATPDYKTPMRDDLLWVYEGLTEYFGWIVSARAGFFTPASFVDRLDYITSLEDNQSGRVWRSIQDTADGSTISRQADEAWRSWRRRQDYYYDGALLWLAADAKIRQLTHGQKSLDDFAVVFFGNGGNSGWAVVPYGFEDVVRALNMVAPYDWAFFWTERLNSHVPPAPVEGLEAAGYRFEYREQMVPAETALDGANMVDAQKSLGIMVGPKGEMSDVRYGSPAFAAGLGPGDVIKTVNGQPYSAAALRKALRDAKTSAAPIVLLTVRDDEEIERKVDYHGGEQFPWLVRETDRPDLLMEIVKPRAALAGK